MRMQTHLAGGVLAYTVSATFFHLPWTATGLVVASAAAVAPDVDTLGSTVGRIAAPLARRIERRWGHRTVTHCYAAQVAVAVASTPLLWSGLPGGPLPHLYAAVVAGYASHPFLDTLTVQGVRVFWPWSDRRGVFPYYNRQATAYRTTTGSRVDTLFGVGCLCLTVPFAVVQVDGYQRLVRRIQADAGAAVRDFVDWSAEGHLVTVDVEASDPQQLRRLTGRFDAVGTTGVNTLLVRDPRDGRLFALGPAYSADFQPDRVVARRGPRVTVSRRRVDLAGRVLADLEDLVPRTDGGARARHLLDGRVTLTEPAVVTPDAFHFDAVSGRDRQLTLQFATLADLERLALSGHVVESGVVHVRVYRRDGDDPPSGRPSDGYAEVRRISFSHAPGQPPDLWIAEGDTVARGDTLAVIVSDDLQAARLGVDEAVATLDAARAERPPHVPEAVALRQRVADAEAAAARIEARAAEGFEAPGAVATARRAVAHLSAQLGAAEHAASARRTAWARGRAERVRAASARLQRARLRLATAEREGHVVAPSNGAVRRIEQRSVAGDRAEVRVVLVVPRPRAPPPRARP